MGPAHHRLKEVVAKGETWELRSGGDMIGGLGGSLELSIEVWK